MSQSASITAAVFDKILAFLAPLFLIAGTSDMATARDVARTTLATYGARTDRELRFAALSIAFSFGALEALSKAADPDLAMNQMLRLCGTANALNRAAHQNEARLEKLLKQPPAMDDPEDAIAATPDAPTITLPNSSATDDLLIFARSRLNAARMDATPSAPAAVSVAPLSRQQRRAAERKAEKARQRQAEEARLAQRAAQLAARAREVAPQRP
jgi:hypothetical protein